ncbi:hypothetical protein LUZ60_014634 [Juncus effusus]|nr:hypothetical protein LUZ60_014634 [Juncus effusus]
MEILHSPSTWLKLSCPLNSPFIFSSSPQRRSLRIGELHAKRRNSNSETSTSDKKNKAKEVEIVENNSSNKNKTDEEEDDEIPQEVFDRMMKRISFAVGIPIGSGILTVYLLDKLNKAHFYEPPYWLPYLIILASFGSGSLGIAYGTLSSSWDPDKEGSLFGLEQIEKNWPVLWKDELEKKKEEEEEKKKKKKKKE